MEQTARILVADDDRDVVRTLRDHLEAMGFETLAAYEGIRTIEAAHKEKPDLILLDIKMPAGEGGSILKALRAHPDTERIPVIVLTGVTDPELKQEILMAGAQAFFYKPYDIDKLMEETEGLLNF